MAYSQGWVLGRIGATSQTFVAAGVEFGSGYDCFDLCEYVGGSVVWNYTTSVSGDSLASYLITLNLNGSDVSATIVGPGVNASLSASDSELTSNTNMGIATYQNGSTWQDGSFSYFQVQGPAATAAFGQPTTLTATVAAVSATPSGSVTFFDGSTPLGIAIVDGSGKAALTTSALSIGDHSSISAVYNGDGDCSASTSSGIEQDVGPGILFNGTEYSSLQDAIDDAESSGLSNPIIDIAGSVVGGVSIDVAAAPLTIVGYDNATITAPSDSSSDPNGAIIDIENGAAVFIGNVTIDGSTATDEALVSGINVDNGGTLNLWDSTVTNIQNSSGTGTAIDVGVNNASGTVNLSGDTFTNYQNAGVFDNASAASATIDSCTFTGNANRSNGIVINDGDSVSVTNSTFSANAFGIDLQSVGTSDSAIITGNTISGSSAGVYANFEEDAVTTTIADNAISESDTPLYLLVAAEAGTVTISNNTLSDAYGCIGMSINIYGDVATLTITKNTVTDSAEGSTCLALTLGGDTSGTVTISNNSFLDTESGGSRGMGISIYHQVTTLTITNNTITESADWGNVIYYGGSVGTVTISGNTFLDTGNGVGFDVFLQIYGGTTAIISDNIISASSQAGGYAFWGGVNADATTISGNTISGCSDGGYGLYLSSWSDNPITISGNTISGNDYGIYLNCANPVTMLGNSIIDNVTGIVAWDESTLTANFNRIVGNTVALDNESSGTIDATDNWWGSNSGPAAGSVIYGGPVNLNPYLVLSVNASLTCAGAGETVLVTADLTHNSNGDDTSALGCVPDGIPVAFDASNGSESSSSEVTANGQAATALTMGDAALASATATVDGVSVTTDVAVPHITLSAQVLPGREVLLSGVVSDIDNPAGVKVTFTGAASGSTFTDINGDFSYTTTQASQGTVFAAGIDQNQELTNQASAEIAVSAPTLALSITDIGEGSVTLLGQVTDVDPAGEVVTIAGLGSVMTDADGNFVYTAPVTSSGTLQVSATNLWGQTSNVVEVSVQNVSSIVSASITPQITLNVQVLPGQEVQLSGVVMDDVPAGATVTFTGAVSGSTTTDANGNFSFTATDATLGTVYASAVDQSDQSTNTASANIAVPTPVLTIWVSGESSGIATINGKLADLDPASETVQFSGAASGSVTTDSSGNFSVTVYTANVGNLFASATDLWGQTSNTEEVSVPADVIGIVDFAAIRETSNVWTFEGRVIGAVPGEVTVQLGGLPSLNSSAPFAVAGDGTFAMTETLGANEWGTATALAIDSDDNQSNLAAAMVFNHNGSWSASNTGAGPVLDNPGEQYCSAGQYVALNLRAFDQSNDLTFSETGLPDGLHLDANNGVITGIVADDAVSTTPDDVSVTVTDGLGNHSTVEFDWCVALSSDENDVLAGVFGIVDFEAIRRTRTIWFFEGRVIGAAPARSRSSSAACRR